ncbi:MAG TPA: DUF6084 family protein [Ktedonobacteraceae bacterium]|jgi:hypothetical protein|nr:DUF6084 family protein [Ktedonobacteraceae bacterium]
MPDLSFKVVGAEVPAYAAVPTLIFKLHITNAIEQQSIHSVTLHSQIQLAVTRRRYSPEAQAQLLELFGEPKRWGETLRSLLWTHSNVFVPQFSGDVTVDLPIACTYDFEVVAAKYFHALGDGDIPLEFLFSGTIFYEGEAGNLQVAQISWSKEASYRLPVTVWQEMMARYYPNSAYIRLNKDVFDRLYQYKATHSLPNWEDAIVRLLQSSDEEVRS